MDYGNEFIPGGAKFGVGGGNPRFTKGTTWCLDVLGALKDSSRDIPAKNHWTLLDTAAEVRPYCCPTADRKSTRLNSSHGYISYAVFCLKKKQYGRSRVAPRTAAHKHPSR